ncbi:MAG TPA: hypothetical protein P5511_02280, partial [Candidatus Goldiibacteriota bacterium]|nr:hypothetical protein [Candidatus Goldiibacteriota bacterium]
MFSAPRLLFVAPGESFTPGSAKTGTPSTQVSGVPFHVTIYSVDDSTWNLLNTNSQVTVAASQTTTYNPTSPFFLSDDSVSPAVNDCKRIVTFTIDPGVASGSVNYTASGTGGIANGTLAVNVQKVNDLFFNAISSPQTAGTNIPYTVTARQAGGATATAFNGTAQVSAVYSGQNITVSVGNITFTNGVSSGNNALLYDA